MNPEPLLDNVLVRLREAPATTESGIHLIRDHEQVTTNRGFVVKVGPGKLLTDGTHAPMPVEPGDEIIFSRFTGSEIKFRGESLLIVPERDILAIVNTPNDEPNDHASTLAA